MSVGAVVLAAGQGTRMRSRTPKVLHPLAGRSMLGWVLAALGDLSLDRAVVVVGHGAEDVEATLPEGVVAAVQHEQRGTERGGGQLQEHEAAVEEAKAPTIDSVSNTAE